MALKVSRQVNSLTYEEPEMSCSDSNTYKFVIVGRNLSQNVRLKEAIKTYSNTIIFSNTGLEHIGHENVVFVLEDFRWDLFHTLNKHHCRIYGPTVILQSVGKPLPASRRPLFCTSMQAFSVCFSNSSDLAAISKKVHYMGGMVKKDMSQKVTHLVTTTSSSAKYKVAMSMGTSIMTEAWVEECWARNGDESFRAEDVVANFRWLPFTKCHLHFLYFSRQELVDLNKLTTDNGGRVTELMSCTHVVVNEQSPSATSSMPPVGQGCAVVNSSWFWASIQMEACADVTLYFFRSGEEEEEEDGTKKQGWVDKKSYNFCNYPENTKGVVENGIGRGKGGGGGGGGGASDDLDRTVVEVGDKRMQTLMELCQTEDNYVGILNLLLDLYKKGLEDENQPGGAVLNAMEAKTIFQGVVQLASLHRGVLVELKEVIEGDRQSVGEVFNKRVAEMARVYPSFVNFLQTTRQTISDFRATKPRFQAFLMLCQRRVECGRQTLEDLMVRPVQRLPSTLLLLRELLKRTDQSHSDHQPLQEAISALDEVIVHINEAKRRVDMHLVLFDVLEGIHGGQSLLSAHRHFVVRVAVLGVGGRLLKKMESYSLLLFNDCLAICKGKLRKEKLVGSVELCAVRKVVDVAETKNFKHLLALIVEVKDSDFDFMTFNVEDNSLSKLEFLSMLLHHTCISTNTSDQSCLLDACSAEDLNIDSDGHNSLRKTLRRLTRNLSLTKSSSSKKTDDSAVVLRCGSSRSWTSDESFRSSVDWSSSVRSCNSDKENYSTMASPMDQTLMGDGGSRAKTLTHSMNDLNSLFPSSSPTKTSPYRHAISSLRRPRTLIS